MEPAAGPKGSSRERSYGPSTRAVHAGLPLPEPGTPILPPPALAAPYHLPGPADASPYGYARYANPSWTALETAIGELEGGEAVIFGSGMAAVSAVLLPRLRSGSVLVACSDGYPGIRWMATDHLAPRGVDVRFVRTDTEEIVAACAGATMVWIETPANPGLEICDVAAVAEAAHAAGAVLVADNSLATPLGMRPLELGADVSVAAGTKALAGHADLLLGYVAARDRAQAEALRVWRGQTGSIAGPFEAWLAHRSLATLALRLDRMSENALAVARLLSERDDVLDVRHPGLPGHPGHDIAARQMDRYGPLVGFTLAGAEAAQRFLSAARLIVEATSFGGIHTTAERRGRWGTDAVPDGFIRFSAGCEDTEDLLADVSAALDASR